MPAIKTNPKQTKMLARLMRAEAEGDGRLGMLTAGSVMTNRVLADCLDFVNIRSIQDMVYQTPGGFEAVTKPYFFQGARESDIKLAEQVIRGERFRPAENALWFFRPSQDCPDTWYNQRGTGRYKNHCFFAPTEDDCRVIFRG